MPDHLPIYITLFFVLTVITTLWLFFKALESAHSPTTQRNAYKIVISLTLWLIIQAVLSLMEIYNTNTHLLPPRIVLLGIAPPVWLIIMLFATKRGRRFIDSLPLAKLTCLNIVRIPVELVLFWLALHKAVPWLMTFEGSNFDIFAGITAPLITYFCFRKRRNHRIIILVWNFICLALLINIIVLAFLSAPSPLQQLAFDQPNIAILNFPYSWLPTFIVPIILFGHLSAIKQLLK